MDEYMFLMLYWEIRSDPFHFCFAVFVSATRQPLVYVRSFHSYLTLVFQKSFGRLKGLGKDLVRLRIVWIMFYFLFHSNLHVYMLEFIYFSSDSMTWMRFRMRIERAHMVEGWIRGNFALFLKKKFWLCNLD